MDKYKNLIYIMSQTSPDYQESDEDLQDYIQTQVQLRPEFIENVRKEYRLVLIDSEWDWLSANRETNFIGQNDSYTSDDIHTAFKEKVWLLIK